MSNILLWFGRLLPIPRGAIAGGRSNRRGVTYGFNAQADVRAVNLTYSGGSAHFDVEFQEDGTALRGLRLPLQAITMCQTFFCNCRCTPFGRERGRDQRILENFKGSIAALPKWAGGWRHHH